MELFASLAKRIGPLTRFTRYRGDGWQIYLDDPGLGLWAMILFAASARAANGLQSRIALGLGSVYGGSPDSLTTAGGTAFVASGRALDKMSKAQCLALAGDGVDVLHSRLVSIIDMIISDWSREQAEAVAMALRPEDHPTQADIAEYLGITRQAVAARLAAANFHQIDAANDDFFFLFHRDGAADG